MDLLGAKSVLCLIVSCQSSFRVAVGRVESVVSECWVGFLDIFLFPSVFALAEEDEVVENIELAFGESKPVVEDIVREMLVAVEYEGIDIVE